MAASSIRLVLDTNVIVRGLVNTGSTSGRVLGCAERRRAILLLSKPVLHEYRTVLHDPEVVERYPELTPEHVDASLEHLKYFGEYMRLVPARFEFPRDPRDAMLLELAIAGNATDIVSADKDLLSLRGGHTDAAKRLRQRMPSLRVLSPVEFLDTHSAELEGD